MYTTDKQGVIQQADKEKALVMEVDGYVCQQESLG